MKQTYSAPTMEQVRMEAEMPVMDISIGGDVPGGGGNGIGNPANYL